ncbi:MAG: Tol-Pal system protein TolB, partial [Porticoccus sp.]|nr:Tol-Pal system protein TolB [Porticoccus sp.]
MRKSGITIGICLLVLMLPLRVLAELTIEITQGVDNPTRIGISPITHDGKSLPEDVSKIVSADLERSGLFKSIPKRDMLSFPATIKEVYYRDWRILGAEYLVVGKTSQRDGIYQITFSLLEVHSSKAVFTKVVKGSNTQLRDLAHYISDEIYLAVTG